MTVQELVERLQECDPDAEVRITSQEGWPFECAISGVAAREAFGGDESCECDHAGAEPHQDACPAVDGYDEGLHTTTDVFIVEGQQERSGSEAAWNLVRAS